MKLLSGGLLCLLLLSCANALTYINIESNDTTLSSSDDLTFNYEINLNSANLIDYSIRLYNDNKTYLLVNNSINTSFISDSVSYDLGLVASGTYQLSLTARSKLLNATEIMSHEITILKELNFRAIVPLVVYADENLTSAEVLLTNNGNTDVSISVYFKPGTALADVAVSPQSFNLLMSQNKTVTLTFAKPTSDYNTTLVIRSIDDTEIQREYPISVIIPVVNMSLNNVNVTDDGNQTQVTAQINNTGNMPINATLLIRTFTLSEGFQTESEGVTVNPGEQLDYSHFLPSGKGVVSVSLVYLSDGQNVTDTEELNVLNRIPIDLKLSQDRIILIIILIAVIIIVIYVKRSKGKRP